MTLRTENQNNAIHLYCERLAEALNDAGYEIKKVMEVKTADVPWTKESVKELLWRPLQEAAVDKHSTKALEKMDVDRVYSILDRHISSNFGVHIEFPSKEQLEAMKQGKIT
jgi:hypothetical protein